MDLISDEIPTTLLIPSEIRRNIKLPGKNKPREKYSEPLIGIYINDSDEIPTDTCPSESLKIKTLDTFVFVISAFLSKLSPISLSLTATPAICELPSPAIPLPTAVPKRKGGRLVGLARRASSYPASSSQVSYTDPMILEQLQNKDERIVALDEQNATILSENATILAQLKSQKKTNAEILEKLDRLLPSGS
ncbi:hypothetical protein F2Q69_00004148 [Brassica cretica]|uniref:Uncharacterized protein n=1 Tax=Brassica cretica TaxID=69181 RepID=A0A8S9P312_BRACR|nr:hypothetical protein F2Q69_00004148 [Brassica cretica]